MAARRKKKIKINLLPQEEFAASTLGRILTWALSSFRIIVIATELVVVAAFLSRFWFDARSTDLGDEIEEKQAIIASYSSIEKEFRVAQQKLKIFNYLTTPEQKISTTLQALTAYMPSDVSLSSLLIDDNQVQIKATAQSEQSIAQFLVNLEATEQFEEVALNQMESTINDPFISFIAEASLKGEQ